MSIKDQLKKAATKQEAEVILLISKGYEWACDKSHRRWQKIYNSK